jgi:hypothetical protein
MQLRTKLCRKRIDGRAASAVNGPQSRALENSISGSGSVSGARCSGLDLRYSPAPAGPSCLSCHASEYRFGAASAGRRYSTHKKPETFPNKSCCGLCISGWCVGTGSAEHQRIYFCQRSRHRSHFFRPRGHTAGALSRTVVPANGD